MAKHSDRTRQLIANGLSKGLSLTTIAGDPDYIASVKQDAAETKQARDGMRAHEFLANGNHGPFKSAEERERAFSHPLYASSEEYRTAVMHKASQSSDAICGVRTPPMPLTPAALMHAAQIEALKARRDDAFDRANSPNKVVATSARLEILEMANNPEYQAIERALEPAPRPLEDALKATGPWVVQTFPEGTEAENAAECQRRNEANYFANPGGLGDGGAAGEPNTTLR